MTHCLSLQIFELGKSQIDIKSDKSYTSHQTRKVNYSWCLTHSGRRYEEEGVLQTYGQHNGPPNQFRRVELSSLTQPQSKLSTAAWGKWTLEARAADKKSESKGFGGDKRKSSTALISRRKSLPPVLRAARDLPATAYSIAEASGTSTRIVNRLETAAARRRPTTCATDYRGSIAIPNDALRRSLAHQNTLQILNCPPTADSGAGKTFNLGSGRNTAPIVPLDYAEKGLRAFNDESVRYGGLVHVPSFPSIVNIVNRESTTTEQLRIDGGIPSSPAFTHERAVDDARFAARAGASQESVSAVTSKERRDHRLTEASPSAPPSFTLGPSSATRPISRTATAPVIGSEEDLTPAGKEPAVDLTGGDNPIAAPDAVSTLKLLPPPPMKDGKKETSGAMGIRTCSNTMTLANHVVTMQQNHAALALDVANTVRRLEGKIAHALAKESVDVVDVTEVAQLTDDVVRHGVVLARIEREQARVRNTITVLDTGNSGAKEDGAGLHRIDLLAKEVKGEFNVVYSDIAALQDGQARRANHDEDYATLEARVDTLVAENDKLIMANKLLEDRVAVVEAKPPKKDRELEMQVLEVRKTLAQMQLVTMKKTTTTSADNDAEGLTFDLGTARKRSVAADAETSSSKRPKVPASVGDKADYKHWVKMARLPRMSLFFVERPGNKAEMSIGFIEEDDAATLVRRWAAEPKRPFPDVAITMVKKSSGASGSGQTTREKEIALLSGNL
ncbi:hypothetical protein B0H13DRAFT_1896387 [Mycena leptocephala]|nr:hypothetical protein B0H13DRAFT_1896387 [Mycena leptocephala]